MEFSKVQEFAGPLDREALKYVDYYIGENMGIFIPNGGIFEYALDPHALPSYMFAFMYHERAYVCIDDVMIPLKPGGLLSVSPGVEHYEVPMDSQSRYVCVNIRPSYFDKLYKDYTGEEIPEYRGEYNTLLQDLPELIKSYIYEYEHQALGVETVCLALENLIIHKILRSLVGKKENRVGLNIRFEIEKSVQYMYHHMHDKIKVADLAKDVEMSSSQYSKVFKEEMNITPMEYLNDIRLERSKSMLLGGNMNILKVSIECGFTSTSYFTQKFKEKYNLTPSEYRNQHEVKVRK